MGKTHIIAMGLILALFLAGLASSQGIGNSKSYDQNSYDWMGTPVVISGQTNAIVPDYLEAYGAQSRDRIGTHMGREPFRNWDGRSGIHTEQARSPSR